MHKSIVILVAGAAAFGLLVGGCGGSGGADAEQIDKATFVKRANEICEEASGKLVSAMTSISGRESAKPNYDYVDTQTVIVKTVLVPRFEEELREIRALGIPGEAKKDSQALLRAYEVAIEKIKAKPRAVANATAEPYVPVEVAGTAFGVSECPIAPVGVG